VPSVGILLPTREAAIKGNRDAAALVELSQRIEDAGFDSIWAGDSLTARPRAEPLTLLTGVAAVTERATLGTAALTGAIRNPILAAHAIATLDQVARGRLILGLGSGFPYPETQAEFEVAGAHFEERVGRTVEAVRVWRALWDPKRDPDVPLDLTGRYWSFAGVESITMPTRPGGPPMWLAGAGDRALRHAGRFFDGWLPYIPEVADYRRSLDVVRAEEPVGPRTHPFTPALYATLNLDSDPRKARAELADYIQAYYGFSLEIMETLQAMFAGRADWSAEWLSDFVTTGAEHIVIRIGSFDFERQLEVIAEQVLPALRDQPAQSEGQ
jgi:alkanesulfonate monooxygenase SsuD/methylene tetrahydromethanopterin reductase-like flavin-dependent oxidoreductase (luciferase family)